MSDSSKDRPGSENLLATAMRRVFEEEIGEQGEATKTKAKPAGRDHPTQGRGAA